MNSNIKIYRLMIILMIILNCIFAGCSPIEGESGTPAPDTTLDRENTGTPIQPATPFSKSPTSGICAEIDGAVVTITINPDVPMPRCVKVKGNQMLKIVNMRNEAIHVLFGPAQVELIPKEEFLLELEFSSYLMPGVHLIEVIPCCSPELWLEE